MGWGTGATRGSVFGLDSRAAGDVGFGEVPEELDSERTRWARDSEGAEFMMSGSPAATGGCAGRALGRRQDGTTRLGGWGAQSGAETGTCLGVPVVFVVLGGDDDDDREDGTEHHGCDAHGQGDE